MGTERHFYLFSVSVRHPQLRYRLGAEQIGFDDGWEMWFRLRMENVAEGCAPAAEGVRLEYLPNIDS